MYFKIVEINENINFIRKQNLSKYTKTIEGIVNNFIEEKGEDFWQDDPLALSELKQSLVAAKLPEYAAETVTALLIDSEYLFEDITKALKIIDNIFFEIADKLNPQKLGLKDENNKIIDQYNLSDDGHKILLTMDVGHLIQQMFSGESFFGGDNEYSLKKALYNYQNGVSVGICFPITILTNTLLGMFGLESEVSSNYRAITENGKTKYEFHAKCAVKLSNGEHFVFDLSTTRSILGQNYKQKAITDGKVTVNGKVKKIPIKEKPQKGVMYGEEFNEELQRYFDFNDTLDYLLLKFYQDIYKDNNADGKVTVNGKAQRISIKEKLQKIYGEKFNKELQRYFDFNELYLKYLTGVLYDGQLNHENNYILLMNHFAQYYDYNYVVKQLRALGENNIYHDFEKPNKKMIPILLELVKKSPQFMDINPRFLSYIIDSLSWELNDKDTEAERKEEIKALLKKIINFKEVNLRYDIKKNKDGYLVEYKN